jgi:serine/threonine protein kinase
LTTSFEPQEFGRYYLVDKIAVGGMAEVFKARIFSEGGFQKLLVIKRILGHLSGNDEFVDMFIDEAKISVELQHPNIVQVYDFGKLRDNYFIAMECVEGKDVKGILRKLAERRKILPVEYAACIAHEMAKGLDFAHKKADLQGKPLGIIHRDISPSNILVSYDGEVKVADFGIAKAQISLYNTKDGVLKGKFEYMSPEQASGEDITPSSDIFAAGIILHEMLTGRRLFKTDSEIKTLNKIKAVDVPLPSELNPTVPARMDEIVMKALSRDPADRFKDCRALQQALIEFMYPSTPDVVRDSLKHFMAELFSEEIAAERERLQAGSDAAVAMWESAEEIDLEEEWSEEAGSARTIQKAPSRLPLVIVGFVALLALGVAGYFALREPVTRIVEVEKTVSTGSFHVRITPDDAPAVVYLGGKEVASGSGMVLVEDVEPGADLSIRVVAEGYEPYEDTIDLVAGERLRFPVTLKAPVVEPPPADPVVEAPPVDPVVEPPPKDPVVETPAAAAPPKARFTSTPAGAQIYVDGKLVGRTPMTWTDGTPGSSVQVEYRLDGHATASFSATVPGEGKAEAFNRSLAQEAAAPGKVSVNVKSGWADVFIDGKKVDTTPLFNHGLSAGSHTIRVVNEASGVDQSRTVNVTSGETTSVTF